MKDLTIYLNDHLAGSVGALEMLDGIIDAHEGKPLESFVKQLRKDISADQRELKRLMKQLGIAESGVRKVGAWVAEKLSRAKLRMGDSGKSNLALLQSLESLSLGITGKRSLWRTLGAFSKPDSRLDGINFARLEKRAIDQFKRAEGQAQKIAVKIFSAELKAPRRN